MKIIKDIKANKTIYWTVFSYKKWRLHVAAVETDLCYLGSQIEDYNQMVQWLNRYFQDYNLIMDHEKLAVVTNELIEYLDGSRNEFTFSIQTHGTAFQQKVWQTLRKIPYGKTISYSDIAKSINNPSAVRAVGAAVGANPLLIVIPCHRVIGKDGSLTGFRGGLQMKKQLLQLEGYLKD